VTHPPQTSLGVLNATVERNAYGRQIDSSIETGETQLPGGPLEMVYIRAPRIVKTGDGVEILAERDGFPVLVEQGHLMAATFHPELSADRRVHQRFVELVRDWAARQRQKQ
jgi:5'-phosphate synthase pdxT subunit